MVFVVGLLMIPFCFLLSTVPAVYLSGHTPRAKALPYLGGGDLIWVAPWLYYLSLLFYYLTFASLAAAALGIFWFLWQTKRDLRPGPLTDLDSCS